MKISEELKIKRAEKVARMQAILDARKENGILRAATDTERTEYDALKVEVERFDTDIKDAEDVETRSASDPQKRRLNINTGKGAEYNIAKAMREFARGGESALTGQEAEQHKELSRGITDSNGLLVPFSQRDQNTTSNADSIDVKINPGLSIIGKEPLYQQMGLTVLNGLTGTLKIGKKSPDVAADYAEKAPVTGTASVPTFEEMAPKRFGITDIFTKELLAQENPMVHSTIISDMVKSCDRFITADAYAVALAAATETAGGALTAEGLNALMAAIDIDGAFAMTRKTFFAGKGALVGANTAAKFMFELTGQNGIGRTYDGVNAYFSTLFADGANQQYLVYGAWSEIWAGFWGALEILINPYTYQKNGQIELTVNKLGKLVCRNDAAFVKSPDLDATT